MTKQIYRIIRYLLSVFHPLDFKLQAINKSIKSLQGYNVTIYDLGGSKSFRGIWPKYYHEVHGFIFVVDSSDSARLSECSNVLQGMLGHSQVQGKPILLLANKADIEHAQVRLRMFIVKLFLM